MEVGGLERIELRGKSEPGFEQVLTPAALAFVATLEREFRERRRALLARRRERQAELDAGARLTFPAETSKLRDREWRVAPAPKDLLDRRVELTGPVDRKTLVNGLNSAAAGVRVFMADYEDANAPTWSNCVQGQANVRDATRRALDFESGGKRYRLAERTATLLVRPRGWHLPEKHLLVDGAPVSASLFDFGLDFFHNARERIERGSGPYYYLPKLESRHEAQLWNDVFALAQDTLSIPRGTIRATVLIETLPAAFEMDEILHALRDHASGLNCGRWDYIFSAIKTMRARPEWRTPDRAQMTMGGGFLRAYAQRLVAVCHRRGAHAMGGMAAQIPIKDNAKKNELALERVRADKEREVAAGHDGTWIAHPGLAPLATAIFDAAMPGPNQIERARADAPIGEAELLEPPRGDVTNVGLETNVGVAMRYLEAWLRGVGCVPLNDLMEDAATAEISRTQVWQWIRHGARLQDGRLVTVAVFRGLLKAHFDAQRGLLGSQGFAGSRFARAAALLDELVAARDLPEFLTLPAYEHLD
jgi:malate synthase